MKQHKLVFLFFSLILFTQCVSKKKFSENILEFMLPKDAKLLDAGKQFYNNPTGDGEQYAIYKITKASENYISKQCQLNGFHKLPIDGSKLPEGSIYKWIDRKDTLGYYKLKFEPNNKLSYSIVVVSFDDSKIVIYRAIY